MRSLLNSNNSSYDFLNSSHEINDFFKYKMINWVSNVYFCIIHIMNFYSLFQINDNQINDRLNLRETRTDC